MNKQDLLNISNVNNAQESDPLLVALLHFGKKF